AARTNPTRALAVGSGNSVATGLVAIGDGIADGVGGELGAGVGLTVQPAATNQMATAGPRRRRLMIEAGTCQPAPLCRAGSAASSRAARRRARRRVQRVEPAIAAPMTAPSTRPSKNGGRSSADEP